MSTWWHGSGSIDLQGGRWCELCYEYHILAGDLEASLRMQGYSLSRYIDPNEEAKREVDPMVERILNEEDWL